MQLVYRLTYQTDRKQSSILRFHVAAVSICLVFYRTISTSQVRKYTTSPIQITEMNYWTRGTSSSVQLFNTFNAQQKRHVTNKAPSRRGWAATNDLCRPRYNSGKKIDYEKNILSIEGCRKRNHLFPGKQGLQKPVQSLASFLQPLPILSISRNDDFHAL